MYQNVKCSLFTFYACVGTLSLRSKDSKCQDGLLSFLSFKILEVRNFTSSASTIFRSCTFTSSIFSKKFDCCSFKNLRFDYRQACFTNGKYISNYVGYCHETVKPQVYKKMDETYLFRFSSANLLEFLTLPTFKTI